MKNKIAKNSQLIEVVIPASFSAGQQAIGQQNQLTNTKIQAIEVYCDADMTKSPSGNAIIPAASLKLLYLTLYCKGTSGGDKEGTNVAQIPFASLHRLNVSSGASHIYDLQEFDDLDIDWQKSYVTIASGTTWSVLYSVIINVFYRYPNQIQQPNGGR